jgi:1-phosphofructokinase family hexose kinase
VILCVTPSPSIDRLFLVDRLVPGEIHRPRGLLTVPGGKGLNVARAVRTLDADVRVAGIAAGHAGRWLAQELADEGIPAEFVWAAGESRTSTSVAAAGGAGALTEFYEDPQPIAPDDWAALRALARARLAAARWLTLSGSVPPGVGVDGYATLAADARAAGVRVAVDARDEWLVASLAASPDLVKINVAEAQDVLDLGEARRGPACALAAARDLQARGARAAVVTCGTEGLAAVDAGGGAWTGGVDAVGPYPVGSGDACLAGLVASLDRGDSWEAALRLAIGAGAANAEQPGAGRLDPARAGALAAAARLEHAG